MLDLYEEFEKALDELERHQINYALCGGLAVTFLTQPRFTEDIDILVSPEDCERCKAILQPKENPIEFAQTHSRPNASARLPNAAVRLELARGV